MGLSPSEIKAISSRVAASVLASRIPPTDPKAKALWLEGQEIARQIDNGVIYRGPWFASTEGEFFAHLFEDNPKITGTTFACKSLEDCKANLIEVRENWKKEPPVFTKQEKVKSCPNLLPMAEWIKGETPGTCRPCTLTPVVQWYWSELKERGFEKIAAELEAEVDVLEEDNVEQVMAICKDLDEIKANAPEDLRKRLEEFDCAIQSFEQSEVSGEAGTGDSKA